MKKSLFSLDLKGLDNGFFFEFLFIQTLLSLDFNSHVALD